MCIHYIEGKSFIFPDAWTSKHTVNDIHIHCMYRSAGNTHTMIQHLQSELACLEKCACVFFLVCCIYTLYLQPNAHQLHVKKHEHLHVYMYMYMNVHVHVYIYIFLQECTYMFIVQQYVHIVHTVYTYNVYTHA